MKLNFNGEEFRSNYLEKQAVLLHSAIDKSYFDWDCLDELLYGLDPSPATVKLLKEDGVSLQDCIETSHYYGLVKPVISKSKLYEGLNDGATLVLNRLEHKSLKIKRICNEISCLTKGQVVANGYLARRGNSAFGNHWDTHDVFAVQLLGKKLWKIYKPTFKDPIVGQKSKDYRDECPTDPYLEVITNPGDVLYIPRGWWHCAYPSEGECFHLAVGVHKPYIVDYLSWLAGNVLSQDERFREAISLGGDFEVAEDMLSEVQKQFSSGANFAGFEKNIFMKEKFDSGLNLRFLLLSSEDELSNTDIFINSPYKELIQRDALVMSGMNVKSHSIASKLLEGPQTASSLREHFPAISTNELYTVLRGLVASGIART